MVIISAEIGVNHQGDIKVAQELMEAAFGAGADFVKFQKREPELCVPEEQWEVPKETPWGEVLPYLEYRRRMEFDFNQYAALQRECRHHAGEMFFSVWDLPSLEFAERFACPYVKVPSAKLTDMELVLAAAEAVGRRGAGLILSTGMSTAEEIEEALQAVVPVLDGHAAEQPHLPGAELWVLHCHSAYPAPTEELNLRCIQMLMHEYAGTRVAVGYSGHEYGLVPTVAAVALGAGMVERHITLDKTAKGSDHMASLDVPSFEKLVRHVRSLEGSLGTGEKQVWDSEVPALLKLRGGAG